MWDCPHCGCKSILPPIMVCPMCGKPRDVTAEPGQTVEGSDSAPVGSQQEELSLPPSGGDSTEVPSSPGRKTKKEGGWPDGK